MSVGTLPAFDDALRLGTAFLVARVLRAGLLPVDSFSADLQIAAAALLAQAEPGAPAVAGGGGDDATGYAADMDAVVRQLASVIIGALALDVPDAPWAPPEPAPATLADLDALAADGPLPPFLRARVDRDGAVLGMLTLIPAAFLSTDAPGGWSWRALAPGVSSRAAACPGPRIAALDCLPGDAVTLLYPVVPAPP